MSDTTPNAAVSELTDTLLEMAGTLLDEVTAELTRRATADEFLVRLAVPTRPGYEVVCTTAIPYEELVGMKRAAIDPSIASGINEAALCAALMASYCVGMERQGQRIILGGEQFTFTSAGFLDMYRKASGDPHLEAEQAVRLFFGADGSDGHVIFAGNRLLAEAGYGGPASGGRRPPTRT